ncbi:MAG: hypothetical protein KA764_04575, partial [Anaerolineales bacterium]|nr:hypothetical protein [Anaerolineales bacterium]
FVVAGLLTKLLGVMPSLAYNLILPMLFSLVGVNAFGVAYNLVAGANVGVRGLGIRESGVKGLGVPSAVAEAQLDDRAVGEAQTAGDEAAPESLIPNPSADSSTAPEPLISDLSVAPAASSQLPITQSPITNHPIPPSPLPNAYLAGVAAALLIVVLGNLGQVRTYLSGFQKAADRPALAGTVLGDNDFSATLNGMVRVLTGRTEMPVGLGSWYWDATRIVPNINGSGSEIAEFPFFTFLYADLHAHMIVMPFTVLAMGWAVAYLQGFGRRRRWWESLALWLLGGLAIGVTRPSNTWDYPMYLALGSAAVLGAHWLADPRLTRQNLLAAGGRLALLIGLTLLLYRPFDQWVVVPLTELKLWTGERTSFEAYFYIHGLFLFLLVSLLVIEARRWLADTPATVLREAPDWLGTLALVGVAFLAVLGGLVYLGVNVAWVALPLLAWAGLLLLRPRLAPEKRVVFFLLGTGLAVTMFVDLVTLGGDRMNTFFKLYMQVWMLFSVAAGAALAWVWADQPRWPGNWRSGWTIALIALAGAGALYTVTAASAKMRDRFVPYAVSGAGGGCEPLPGVPLPYDRGREPAQQPAGLDGLQYLTWSAYCEQGYFLPLVYDYDAIRWLQANVAGSPVIAEGQTFDLYRISSRYAWNTGLPDVVGWDWHQRQQRGALPTEFITQRGLRVSEFYATLDVPAAEAFLRRYDIGYVIVGPFERAHYEAAGLAKFEQLTAAGRLRVAYQNPGVTIYAVNPPAAGQ